MNEIQILLIISVSILVVSIIVLLIALSNHKRANTIRDQVFMALIKCNDIQKQVDSMSDMNEDYYHNSARVLSYIADTVESLSSSNEMVLRKLASTQRKPQSEKIYPRPQLASEITATIKEQINIELSKSRKLKAPNSNYLNNIVYNVAKTYPEVDMEYIASKCIAMLESMSSPRGE